MSAESSDRAVNMGKASAAGSFQLFLGRVISTVILAIGTIIVGRYISEGEYGLYTVALIPAATLLLFQDWGIGSALTKYCANYRASNREGELRMIIVSGLTFEILTGLSLTLLSLIAANLLASIFGKPESAFLIAVSSITIFSTALSAFSISVIVGFERMGISSIAMIVSATVQGLLAPLLVYLGFGAFGAVVGATVASVASGVTGLAMLYLVIFRKLPLGKVSKMKIFQTLKPLLRYGIPFSIAILIEGVSLQIDNFVMAAFADLAMIGNFAVAANFAVLLTFFIYPLQTVLFPAFSKLDPLRDKELLKTVFASSVKYSSLFLVPATMALMVLSVPLVSTLYGDKWLNAPFFLTLSIAGSLVVLIGGLSCGRLLYGMGETKTLLKLNLLTLCVSVPLAFLLIPTFGVVGAIISGTLIAPSFSLCISIYWIWKHYETKPDFRKSARILFASTIAGLTTYAFLNSFDAASWIMLTTSALLFIFVYLISIPIVGAINKMDIKYLRVMFSEMGKVSKLLEIPLILIEKSLALKDHLFKITNN